jgi:branched-chain amino acid transport system permease protein
MSSLYQLIRSRGVKILVIIVGFGLLIAFPFIINQARYPLHVAITICFNISMATSMWLIWSLGLVSFAHAGFMGIGAYTSALFLIRLGLPLWVGMWAGALLGGLIALVVSVPLMRTRAVYFFMASWAVGEVIKRIFAYYREFLGGWEGLFNVKPPMLGPIDFNNRTAYYYLALIFMVLIVIAVTRMNRSRTGWIFWSIHEAEILSSHVGIHALKYKVLAFTVASSFAALTGALYAHYHQYINPRSFDIWVSEFTLVHVIVGGLSTTVGPILGASVLTLIDELLRPTGFYRVVIFGVILVLTVLFLPGGLESIPRLIRAGFANISDDLGNRSRLFAAFTRGLPKTGHKAESKTARSATPKASAKRSTSADSDSIEGGK